MAGMPTITNISPIIREIHLLPNQLNLLCCYTWKVKKINFKNIIFFIDILLRNENLLLYRHFFSTSKLSSHLKKNINKWVRHLIGIFVLAVKKNVHEILCMSRRNWGLVLTRTISSNWFISIWIPQCILCVTDVIVLLISHHLYRVFNRLRRSES